MRRNIYILTYFPSLKKHPLHTFPTAESIQEIQRQDVIAFKGQHYRPDTTVLAVVGDFDVNKVRSLIQAQLGNWQVKGQPPTIKYPNVGMPKNVVNVNPVNPDSDSEKLSINYNLSLHSCFCVSSYSTS